MYKELWNRIKHRSVSQPKKRDEPQINSSKKTRRNYFNKSFWKEFDDPKAYQYEEKYNKTFGPLFKLLEENGITIGSVVFDIGAGSRPLSKHLLGSGKDKRVVFAVDFLKPKDHRFVHLDTDINVVTQPDTFAYKRKLVEVCEKLDIDPRQQEKKVVDAMIFSEVLNYVPYKDVLSAAIPFLKSGGVLIIYNQPGRTFKSVQDMLPPDGVQSNVDVQNFLADPVFGLECLIRQFSEEKSDFNGEPVMLLVMRKK